ncbi:MAG: Ig-like domain-containing protein, partial [Rahnella inusitata]
VNWSSDNASLKLSGSSSQTNSGGVATITATSVKTADAIMTAALTTPAGSASASKVSYIADASTTQLSAVTADKTQALANGTDLITLSTKVTDAQGNILANTDVNWSTNPATGTLSGSSTKTNAQGIATVTLSSTNVSDYVVTASANGVSAKSSSLVFAADAATAKISTLTADKTTGVVAGKDIVTLTATLLDANNHPVQGATVNWSSDNASGIITPVSGVTNASGVVSATLTSTLAQSTVVTASAGSSQKTLPVEFIADASSAKVTIVADKTQVVANGTDAVTWSATVLDANNNPVNGASVDWSRDNANVTLAGSTSQTQANGKATMTGTSLKTGTAIATATLTEQQSSAQATAVTYIADVSTAKLNLTVDRPSVSADGQDFATYKATAMDANDNLITNTTVNWATTLNKLTASSSVTDSSGVATVDISGTAEGNATVTVSLGDASQTNSDVTFVTKFNADWVISGTKGNYTPVDVTGHPTLGFIVNAPTTGPTELTEVGGYQLSMLTTPMTDEKGNEVKVTIRAQRQSDCSSRVFNSTEECSATANVQAKLSYSYQENQGLPAGVYKGTLHFSGRDWGSNVDYNKYEVNILLTVK